MKLSELMANKTPKTDYTGVVTDDDFVLAVAPDADSETPADYLVVQEHIEKHEAGVNSSGKDTKYIRTGSSTLKNGFQRSFNVSGTRYIGDAFQDMCCSNAVKFGTGKDVERNYVYFCIKTGKGEKGRVAILTNNDQGGDASISVELKGCGAPEDYTYSA